MAEKLTFAEVGELLRKTHREAMARRQREREADFREFLSECDCPDEPETKGSQCQSSK